MKAAVLTAYKQPLEIRELPDPTPGPADAVVKVSACGVCRSDWHLWQEDWTWMNLGVELPRVPGHEFGGVVQEVGAEVRGFRPGERVTVPFHMACGRCDYCTTGRANLCYALGFLGFHHNGGYGEYALVPNADSNLVRLPEQIDDTTAAALGCRYMTAYHGVVDQAAVRPGEWLAVFGIGGVGLAAVQIAVALGAQVIAVSRDATKLGMAREQGAARTVVAGESAAAEVVELTGGGAHVSVDALGASLTALPAVLSLRKGGRHVQLGLTGVQDGGMISLPVDAMVAREIRFLGSIGCPTSSYPGLLSMVSSGKLQPSRLMTDSVSVAGVNDVLARMSDFRTLGFNIITSWAVEAAAV